MTFKPIPQSVPMVREPRTTVAAEQLGKLPETQGRVFVPVPNHSLCSYGHGQNDSYVHVLSGVLMERTAAVVEQRSPLADGTLAVPAQTIEHPLRKKLDFAERIKMYSTQPRK